MAGSTDVVETLSVQLVVLRGPEAIGAKAVNPIAAVPVNCALEFHVLVVGVS
jgi:hypothetical protein